MSFELLRDIVRGRSGGTLIGGASFQAVVAFLGNLVLVRFVTPEQFGHFAVLLAGIGLTFGLISLRPNALIVRRKESEMTADLRSLYFSVATLETLLATGVAFAWLFISGLERSFGSVLIVSIAINHWIRQVKGFYERGMPYGNLAKMEVGAVVSGHAVSVLVAFGGAGALALYLRELVIAVCGGVLYRWIAKPAPIPLRLPSSLELRSIIHEARGVWLEGVLEGSFQRFVILFVNAAAGAQMTGYLFQAHRLAVVPVQVLGPLVNRMALIWFGQSSDEDARWRGRESLLAALFVPGILAAIGAVWLADPIVPFIFGESWRPAAALLSGMVGLVLFSAHFEVNRVYCISTKQTRFAVLSRFAQFVFLSVGYVISMELLGVSPALAAAFGLSAAWMSAFLVLEALLRANRADG